MKAQCFYIISIIVICASCSGTPPPGHARASGFFPKKIFIQSSEGLFVRLDYSKELRLIADAATQTEADTFYFCDLGNNICGLQATNNLYVTAHLIKENHLLAHQPIIQNWEMFKFDTTEKGTTFQAQSNFLYILPDKTKDKVLVATEQNIHNPLCYFKMILIP